MVAADMVASKREALAAAVDDGAALLAVCGGYQLLGHSYQLGEEKLPGLGLADLETVREPGPRLIGNVAIEADLGAGPRLLAGFENHGGRTYLGAGAQPLGASSRATATTASDGFEGVRRDNLIGTYLHGPLLPKNAWLADHLIALALERRYGTRPELEPLDDAFEAAAHESAPRGGQRRRCPYGSQDPRHATAASRSRPRRGPTRSSAAASTGSASAIGASTSWAIRSPGSTRKVSAGSVLSSSTRSSPR